MATFDIIVQAKANFQGYEGNPPVDEADYNARKNAMFSGTAPTWSKIQTEIDAYVSPQASGNTKLLALGLTQAEATALTGYTPSED